MTILQFHERLMPRPHKPEPLTLAEQQELVVASLRLVNAVREFLYTHGSYGRIGTYDPKGSKKHDEKVCPACSELRAAMEEA